MAKPKNTSKIPMDVKVINPVPTITLYFCPYCLTGHMLTEGQKECEICGTKIRWPKAKGGNKRGKDN